MIDAHLAAMAWDAAMALLFGGAMFTLGMVLGTSLSERRWQERVKWMRKR